jgi:hypothetical protein
VSSESKLRLVKTRSWNTVFVKSKHACNRHGFKYTIDIGVKIVFDFANNGILLWYYRKFRSSNTVNFLGKSYYYVISTYCNSWKNGAVPIPAVWYIIKQYELDRKRVLEIGNILSYTYSVRGYMHLPQKNTIPPAIQISLLIFGLTSYYSTSISRDKDYPSKCVKKARWIYMQTQSSWEIKKYHDRRL